MASAQKFGAVKALQHQIAHLECDIITAEMENADPEEIMLMQHEVVALQNKIRLLLG